MSLTSTFSRLTAWAIFKELFLLENNRFQHQIPTLTDLPMCDSKLPGVTIVWSSVSGEPLEKYSFIKL